MTFNNLERGKAIQNRKMLKMDKNGLQLAETSTIAKQLRALSAQESSTTEL